MTRVGLLAEAYHWDMPIEALAKEIHCKSLPQEVRP